MAGKPASAKASARRLSHLDAKGKARMVDVGDKPVTAREALARGEIVMSAAALRLIRRGGVAKGDPLQTARLAGIMAAKQTSALIPLCHPLPLTHVAVELTPDTAWLSHRGAGVDQRADRRRDGSADRGVRRGADDLRHGQGGRQGDGHRRHLPGRENGRAQRALSEGE